MTSLAALTAIAVLSGCGGSPNTPSGSVVGAPGGSDPPPTQLVAVKLTLTVPSSGRGMRPDYISPNTASASVQLASVNGGGVSGVNASIVNTAPKSPNCKAESGATVCTATISGSPGSDVFTVTTYDGLNATGSVLSAGTASAQIAKGGGGLPINNAMSIDIGGFIAKLTIGVSPNHVKRGTPATAAVSLRAFDATGAQIAGGADYQSPIAVSIQGDSTGSFSLYAPGQSGPSLTIPKPTSNITLKYDGNSQAASVTLSATSSGNTGVNTPFALEGHKPPPPPGTIYALNLGTNDGLGATVTEYKGDATGNVAPLRTLNLNAKLYARNIAVDSAGNLYVGYFSTATGLSASTGLPASGNVVAIYAPGANGNDPPTATLVASTSTSTLLFPLFEALNPSDGLTVFGATSVDKNSGDAVLTYANDASGPATPQDGFNFAFPAAIEFANALPTGLAVDTAGNVYYNGAVVGFGGAVSYGVYIAPVADIGNPQGNPSRTIPWNSDSQLTPFETTNVGLDSSSEILVGNEAVNLSGSVSCQGKVNVFTAGTGSSQSDKPLRVLTLDGVFTKNPSCAPFSGPLSSYFPEIALYGSTLFAADAFNNAIASFSSAHGGTIKALHRINGSATGLNAPIAVFVAKSSSGPALAGPVRSGRTSPLQAACARPTCALTRSIRIPSK